MFLQLLQEGTPLVEDVAPETGDSHCPAQERWLDREISILSSEWKRQADGGSDGFGRRGRPVVFTQDVDLEGPVMVQTGLLFWGGEDVVLFRKKRLF